MKKFCPSLMISSWYNHQSKFDTHLILEVPCCSYTQSPSFNSYGFNNFEALKIVPSAIK